MKRFLFLAMLAVAGYCCANLAMTARADDSPKPDEAKASSAATLFDQLDTKKAGKLTSADLGEDKRRLFARLLRKAGKGEDGSLNKDEFIAAMKEDKPIEQPAGRFAQGEGRPDPERMFKFLDKNGDGKLTLDEVPEQFKPRLEAMLKRANKSGDGASLTKEEFTKYASQQGPVEPTKPIVPAATNPPPASGPSGPPDPRKSLVALALLKALDTNGDGELSSAEIAAAPEVLKKLADKEGKITAQALLGDRPLAAIGTKKTEGSPETGDRLNAGRMAKGMIGRFDKNGDGKLSKDEVPEFLKERFDVMDSNKDGQLDEAELEQALSREAFGRMLRERLGGSRPDGEKKPDSDKKPDSEKKPESK